jgi:hypothetical protein
MPIAHNPSTGEVVFLGQDGQWQPAQTAVNPQTKEMLAYDGTDWKPVPASGGVFRTIDNVVRSVASGVTFGWADEFAAKMNEAIGSGNYEENVKQERARDAQIPLTIKLPAEIAGAIGSTVLTAPLAAWRALGAVTSGLPQWARFGALGAAEGALAGAGGADEGTRGSGALTGAAIGAPIGAVAPSVVRGIEGTFNAARNAIRPSSGAAADIGRAIVRDEDTPAAITARMAAHQADRPGQVTIADVGGENVRGLVERVAQTPGAGRTQVVPALTARQTQQADRVSDDLRSLTGTQRTARQALDDTIAERSQAARPLYDDAFNFNARESPEIVRAWDNATATGYGSAITRSTDFRRLLQTEYGVRDAADAPLMVQIDAWKRLADDAVGAATRAGNNNRARVIGTMRDGVLQVVDRQNPTYAAAREAWAGPSRFIDAIEEGRTNILRRNVTGDDIAARLRQLSASEREAYRVGAVSSIVGTMRSDPARLADLTKYLRAPEVRAKVAAIMPTPEAAQTWANRLNFEVRSSELTAQSLGNSATARRLAEQRDGRAIVGDLVMDAMLSGPSSTSFLRSMFTAAPRWLRDTLRSRTDRELADMLVNPQRAGDLTRVVNRARTTQRQAAGRPQAAASATAGGVATAE